MSQKRQFRRSLPFGWKHRFWHLGIDYASVSGVFVGKLEADVFVFLLHGQHAVQSEVKVSAEVVDENLDFRADALPPEFRLHYHEPFKGEIFRILHHGYGSDNFA